MYMMHDRLSRRDEQTNTNEDITSLKRLTDTANRIVRAEPSRRPSRSTSLEPRSHPVAQKVLSSRDAEFFRSKTFPSRAKDH